ILTYIPVVYLLGSFSIGCLPYIYHGHYKMTTMKNYRILLGATFILLSILTACEKEDQGMDDPGSSHDEMTSSYDNTMIMRWDNAISIAIDNKIPTAPESRAYAIVTLAMHDALNNVFPKYETYALSNSARSKTIWSNDQLTEIADAAVARACQHALMEAAPAGT